VTTASAHPVVLLLAPGEDVPARLRALAPPAAPVLVALGDSGTAQDLRDVIVAAAGVGLAPTRVDTTDPATHGLPRVSLVVEFTPSGRPTPGGPGPRPAPGAAADPGSAVPGDGLGVGPGVGPAAVPGDGPAVHPQVVAALLEWAARREADLAAELQQAAGRAEAGDLATDRLARALADRDALAVELESARQAVDALTQDLTRLRRSGTYRVGNLLVRAAREPRRTPAVTRELVGMARRRWRARGARQTPGLDPGRAARIVVPAGTTGPSTPRGTATGPELLDRTTGALEAEAVTGPGPTVGGPTGAPVVVRPIRGSSRMLLAHRTLRPVPRVRPSVAAVVTDVTAMALEPYVDLVVLHPHDAPDLVRRTDPDLVLVETAATGPGQPWAYLGHPGMATRHRALVDALDAARAAGRPVALWGDTSTAEAAALLTVPGLVDVRLGVGNPVVDSQPHVPWDRGVPWHLFAPVGLVDPAAPAAPAGRAGRVHLLDWDLRTPWSARAATLAALADAGPVRVLVPAERVLEPGDLPAELRGVGVERVPWAGTAAAYRSTAIALASPFTGGGPPSMSLLEQLACGVRVVSGPRGGVPDGLADLVTWVGPLPGGRVLADALALGALTPDEQLDQARAVFAAHATPVRLAELTARLGVAADPLVGRRVHVLADAPDGLVDASLVDDVLAQRWRPTGVLLVDGGSPTAPSPARPAGGADGGGPHAYPDVALPVAEARSRFAAAGLPAWTAPAVDPTVLADATWAARWAPHARWGPWHLLDALATAEAAGGRADAVLPGPGPLTYQADLPAAPTLVRAVRLTGAPTVAQAWPDRALAGWARSGWAVLTGGGMVR